MKDSLGREPRWNADRCAPGRLQARPWPLATAEYSLRLSAFRLRISFVRSLSSLPGNPCGSCAGAALPPAFVSDESEWTTGSKSGGDEPERVA